MKFDNSQDFSAALSEQLQKVAEKSGRMQDLVKLRIEVAIERFLSRISHALGAVKGGTAAMLAMPNSPHTKDVDLVISEDIVKDLGLEDMEPATRAEKLADLINEEVLKPAEKDFFRFVYEGAAPITDLKPGHACARIVFRVMVGQTEIHTLLVDVALQNGQMPTITTPAKDMLNFAGVVNPDVRIVTPEYLFADKVTLYLEEHGRKDADRVKDIVHAALVATTKNLNLDELAEMMADRAVHREVVEKLANKIPDAPVRWKDQFEELREEANSSMNMRDAIAIIEDTVKKVREKAIAIAKAKDDLG